MNKRQTTIIPGIMSVVMVLIILVITSFATLYYLEAYSEYQTVNKSYEMANEYYKADKEAINYIVEVKENIDSYDEGDTISKCIDINSKQRIEIILKVEDSRVVLIEYKTVVKNGMEY